MKKIRFRPNIILFQAEGDKDLQFIQKAQGYKLQFQQTQTINTQTGQLDEPVVNYVDLDTGKHYPMKHGQVLLSGDSLKSFVQADYIYVPSTVLNGLFEPVDDAEDADLDTFVPEVAITDEQFRHMAIRACVFMESNCRNANDPHKATNVSGDRGGLTKYGITEVRYPKLDIKNLTYDDAIAIYERDYWPDAKADQLPRPLNMLTYDLCVTSGPKNAFRVLQRAVGTTDDGLWGPKTKEASWKACDSTPKMLTAVRLFTEKRIAFYQAIVKNDSTQAKFLNGWINRAVRCQNFAQALLHTLDIL